MKNQCTSYRIPEAKARPGPVEGARSESADSLTESGTTRFGGTGGAGVASRRSSSEECWRRVGLRAGASFGVVGKRARDGDGGGEGETGATEPKRAALRATSGETRRTGLRRPSGASPGRSRVTRLASLLVDVELFSLKIDAVEALRPRSCDVASRCRTGWSIEEVSDTSSMVAASGTDLRDQEERTSGRFLRDGPAETDSAVLETSLGPEGALRTGAARRSPLSNDGLSMEIACECRRSGCQVEMELRSVSSLYMGRRDQVSP